jgi:transcription elongation factor GreA
MPAAAPGWPAVALESRLDLVTSDVHITPEGLESVRKELDQLVTVRRPAIVAKIKAAREFGDLSENFEYHAAKNEQGFMEARVKELEAIIKNHVLIERAKSSGVVSMGSTVRFREDDASDEAYRIVGPAEADPKAGTVSYESALGKALLGHRVGEEVEVKTPNGSYRVRIVAIE